MLYNCFKQTSLVSDDQPFAERAYYCSLYEAYFLILQRFIPNIWSVCKLSQEKNLKAVVISMKRKCKRGLLVYASLVSDEQVNSVWGSDWCLLRNDIRGDLSLSLVFSSSSWSRDYAPIVPNQSKNGLCYWVTKQFLEGRLLSHLLRVRITRCDSVYVILHYTNSFFISWFRFPQSPKWCN